MESPSSTTELDVIDLIINVLRDHEDTLDRLIERLDILISHFEEYIIEDKIILLKKLDTSTRVETLTERINILEQQIKKNGKLLESYLILIKKYL